MGRTRRQRTEVIRAIPIRWIVVSVKTVELVIPNTSKVEFESEYAIPVESFIRIGILQSKSRSRTSSPASVERCTKMLETAAELGRISRPRWASRKPDYRCGEPENRFFIWDCGVDHEGTRYHAARREETRNATFLLVRALKFPTGLLKDRPAPSGQVYALALIGDAGSGVHSADA